MVNICSSLLPIYDVLTHLVSDHLSHDISGVYINRTDSHDLLPVTFGQLSDQHSDELVELLNLLLIVVLEGVLIALL